MKKNIENHQPAAINTNGILFGLVAALLSACSASNTNYRPHTGATVGADLICKNPSQYANQKVGDGHCVSLIKKCSGAPDTVNWRPGERVLSSKLMPGTIIATFRNNRYPSKHGHHAAIYIRHDKNGIWVWDQWQGKPVHQRLISVRNDGADPGNTAQAYRIVRIP